MKWLRKHIDELTVPAGWSELTTEQFVAIANEIVEPLPVPTGAQLEEVPAAVAQRVAVTWQLLGLGRRKLRATAAFYIAYSDAERFQTCALAEPFMNVEKLTSTPLAYLRVGRHVLHACTPNMLHEREGVDAYIWGLADTWFLRFAKSLKDGEQKKPVREGNMDHLRAMAATLYAVEGVDRADRLKDASIALCNRLDQRQLIALYVMWCGHRQAYMIKAPWVFRAKNEKKVAKADGSWSDVIRSIAGSKFGDYNSTCMTPAPVFLRELSEHTERGIKQREAIEKAKQNMPRR